MAGANDQRVRRSTLVCRGGSRGSLTRGCICTKMYMYRYTRVCSAREDTVRRHKKTYVRVYRTLALLSLVSLLSRRLLFPRDLHVNPGARSLDCRHRGPRSGPVLESLSTRVESCLLALRSTSKNTGEERGRAHTHIHMYKGFGAFVEFPHDRIRKENAAARSSCVNFIRLDAS